ncbi:MAG TPA: hypothetical protein VN764_08820 [Polyangiaceae bacterium]|nr:hypothetical protein [Polyangiaceae bacterium]
MPSHNEAPHFMTGSTAGTVCATLPALSQLVCAQTCDWFDGDIATHERGLYLATADAGVDDAVAFYERGLRETLRFASPADFHWTLSNAPAGQISRELHIQGPCYTLVGRGQAVRAVVDHALFDLARGRVKRALLVACELQAQPQAAFVALYDGRIDVSAIEAHLRQVFPMPSDC